MTQRRLFTLILLLAMVSITMRFQMEVKQKLFYENLLPLSCLFTKPVMDNLYPQPDCEERCPNLPTSHQLPLRLVVQEDVNRLKQGCGDVTNSQPKYKSI
ncbi:MAG: hypothetical protein ACNS62_09920 [Candidatus Cyclobacteriaceae bacterium M3_2C_046]